MLTCFNSSMVQLLDSVANNAGRINAFQFQYGAIIRKEIDAMQESTPGFNSSMVQLLAFN